MDDLGKWEALIGVPGAAIEHAYAFVEDCLPERAVEVAMARAEQKYGRQDWSRWRFRAEWVSARPIVRTIRFVWNGGLLRCVEDSKLRHDGG